MVALNEIDELIAEKLTQIVGSFSGVVPKEYLPYFTFGLFLVLIVIYAIFVWKFYRFLARRDLLELNLKQYTKVETSFWNRLFAVLLFILEFIIILPIVVFFWFVVMAFILLFLAKGIAPGNILLIAACIIGAVRVTSYYSEDLSRDLAKLFPFTILAVALVTPGFFNFSDTIARITEISGLLTHIYFYLLTIMALEFLLRMFYLITPEKKVSDKD